MFDDFIHDIGLSNFNEFNSSVAILDNDLSNDLIFC